MATERMPPSIRWRHGGCTLASLVWHPRFGRKSDPASERLSNRIVEKAQLSPVLSVGSLLLCTVGLLSVFGSQADQEKRVTRALSVTAISYVISLLSTVGVRRNPARAPAVDFRECERLKPCAPHFGTGPKV